MKFLLFAVILGFALAALPTNFDVRTKWTNCAFFILNQQQCGSCWDFCSVESFADRLCINAEAPSGTIMSPQPILDCSFEGCGGGFPSVAWNWLIKNGDTTCTKQCFAGCAPYDSGNGDSSLACHKGTCDSGSTWPSTYYGGSFKALSNGDITTFQTELSTNGPLQACFTVYDNFYSFFDANPKGIYTAASGSVVGGHCVKLVGWGVSNGVNYWTLANSWDTTWGDGGYFKMARGSNLCGIENSVSEGFTAGQAKKKGIPFGVDPMYNASFMVGGWQEHENLQSELIQTALQEAVKLVSARLGRTLNVQKVISAKTQVVAGVNVHFSLSVEENKVMEVKVFRNLMNAFSLVEYKFI
jgi:cathepsin B